MNNMNLKERFEKLIQLQIPIAWIAGVRFEKYENNALTTFVQFDFLNQNPFGSMFWAVEGMAAEFAGGMMLVSKIEQSKQNIASLVVKNECIFHKKALGKISFTCNEGAKIDEAIAATIATGEAQTIVLTSIATDEESDKVGTFIFTWSIKARK